jgi:hypothetical protein
LSGTHSWLSRPRLQRLTPPGELPVNGEAPSSFASFLASAARSSSENELVKPT